MDPHLSYVPENRDPHKPQHHHSVHNNNPNLQLDDNLHHWDNLHLHIIQHRASDHHGHGRLGVESIYAIHREFRPIGLDENVK